MENNWLLRNARIINENSYIEGDVYIENGRIERIGDLSAISKKSPNIDLKGRHLLPGMIDDQVHFREPGLTHKATIHTESMAAVAGGVTSFMEMPNTNPATTDLGELEWKYQIAKQGSYANYSFYFGATVDNLEIVKRLPIGVAAGIKIFMGSSTGNMLVDNQKILEGIFEYSPTIVVTHCEDDKRIKKNELRFRESLGENLHFSLHPMIRDREACLNSTKQAISLANQFRTPLHVLHITTKEECELFEQVRKNKQKPITAEACLHHTFFNDSSYETLGSLIKCNPAIKTEQDRKAIIEAISLNKIDIIATDHAPHTIAEKKNTYFKAPSGLPLLQEAMPLALELVHSNDLTLGELVQKTAHNVAERFKIKERGYIREGYWADLVCVDMKQGYKVRADKVLSKCGWTPFEGERFNSSVWATWVSGQLAWYENKLHPSQGKRIEFGKQR
jgi:dihydroorotase